MIAYDAERRPLLLLPLVLRHEHGVRTARFMGGKHTTFNMALWDRDFAASATAADLDALLSAIRAKSAADVLALTQQPLRWRNAPNPMALLPNQASANDCPLMTIVARRAAGDADQQFVSPPAQGQGTQAASAPGLSLLRGLDRRRDQAAARRFLPHQAAADGGAEAAQRVRGTGRRGFYPHRLHDAAAGRRSRHRHSRPGMRRRGHRDLRRRRRRLPLFDDVQYLHHVQAIRVTVPDWS